MTKGSVGLLELARRPLEAWSLKCSGRLLRQDSQWLRAESKAFDCHRWRQKDGWLSTGGYRDRSENFWAILFVRADFGQRTAAPVLRTS
jgi:hypothetical protein